MGVSEVTLVGNVEVVEVEGEKAKAHKAKYEYDRVAGFSIGLELAGGGSLEAGTSDRAPSSAPDAKGGEGGSGGIENGKEAVNGKGEEPSFIPLAKAVEEEANGANAEPSDEEEDFRHDISREDFTLPWEQSCRKIHSPLLRLHQEIIEFVGFLQPTSEEKQTRVEAISRVKDSIHSLWPHARVEVFGSYETGLYLPTSDIDMVVLNSNCRDIPFGLRKLANVVSRRGIAKKITVLSKARIPIVKFEDVETSLKFDISFDIQGGPEAALFIKDMVRRFPLIRPLVYILKIFLQQRDLNKVYSGGVGSYGLIIMVAVFLMTHESQLELREDRVEKCLGVLLIDFFELYGFVLNMYDVGISCRKGGFFYEKREYGMFNVERPYLLSIEDPLDTQSDIGKNSFNIQKVKAAFQFAHTILTAPSDEFGELLLMRIIRMDSTLVRRLEKVRQDQEGGGPSRAAQAPPGTSGGGKAKRPKQREREAEAPVAVAKSSFTPKEKMGIMGVAISVSSEEGEITISSDEEEGQSRKKVRTS